MSTHVRDDELMDAAEGLASPEVRRHVDACASCRARVEEASLGFDLAQDAEVPEPSPFYWEAFRGKVRRRVAAERTWSVGIWMPALAAAAVAAVAIGWLAPADRPVGPGPTLPAWSATLPAADEELLALAALDEGAAAMIGCTGLSDCLAGLSDEETLALAEALGEELGGGDL